MYLPWRTPYSEIFPGNTSPRMSPSPTHASSGACPPQLAAPSPTHASSGGLTADAYICSTNAMTEKGTLINVDGIGNRVDCDCPERMCKITPILDWPLPGREYPLVLADDIVGI